MYTLPGPLASQAGFVGQRLAELGQHLAELSRRVRESVAEAMRETVARVARDAFDRVLPLRLPDPYESQPLDTAEEGFDPWAEEEDFWPERQYLGCAGLPAAAATPGSQVPVARSAVALGLAAAGWWLGRRGSWWGALAMGLVSGTLAAATRRLTGDGLLLVQAAHEFLTHRQSLSGPGPQ